MRSYVTCPRCSKLVHSSLENCPRCSVGLNPTTAESAENLSPEQAVHEFLRTLQSLERIAVLHPEGSTQRLKGTIQAAQAADRLTGVVGGSATFNLTKRSITLVDGPDLREASLLFASLLAALHAKGISSISLSKPASLQAFGDLADLLAGVSTKQPHGSIEIGGSSHPQEDDQFDLVNERAFNVQTTYEDQSESSVDPARNLTTSNVTATVEEEVPANPSPPSLSPQDRIALIGRLADLRDRNALTEEEFEAEKRKLLNS